MQKGTSGKAIGGSGGGLTTNILALVDALDNLMKFVLMPGQSHDLKGFEQLIEDVDLKALLGDKVFDANWLVRRLQDEGVEVVIAQKANRRNPLEIDEEVYKQQHLAEDYFCQLKELKRIAMCCGKSNDCFSSTTYLAAAVINSR